MKGNENNSKKKTTSFKPSKKKKKKLVTPVTLAQKYECAWNKYFSETPEWKRVVIIEYPTGRQGLEFSSDIAKQAASLAESPNFKPKLAKYLGKAEKDIKPQMLSGNFSHN